MTGAALAIRLVYERIEPSTSAVIGPSMKLENGSQAPDTRRFCSDFCLGS